MSSWKDGYEEFPWCPGSQPCPSMGRVCKVCQQVVKTLDQMEGAILAEKKRHDETCDKLTNANLQNGELAEKWAAAAQKIHDLQHKGSFPFCMQDPCYLAWIEVNKARKTEKRKSEQFQQCPKCGAWKEYCRC